MRTIRFSQALITLLVFLFLLGSCSSLVEGLVGGIGMDDEEESSDEVSEESSVSLDPTEQRVVGTWTNPNYNQDNRSAKLVYTLNADGTLSYIAYDKDDGSGNKYEGTVTYKEQWMDSDGRLNGKSMLTLEGGMSWETLDRISADGNTLEVQSGTSDIDPNGSRYSIYYRK